MTASVRIFAAVLADIPPDPSVLSAAEHARAAQFRSADDRRRYMAAHTWIRHVLADATGVAAQQLKFGIGSYGKPFLTNPDSKLTFNMSHTETVVALAVGQGGAVGIDVEAYDQRVREPTVIDRVLTPTEQKAVAAAKDTDAEFLRLWVRKEALFKATGVGITSDLVKTDVAGPSPLAVGDFIITDVDLGCRQMAAVAAAPGSRVVVQQLPSGTS